MVDKVEYFPGDRRYLQGFLFLIEGQTVLASVIAERMRDHDQCGKRITSRGMGTCFKKVGDSMTPIEMTFMFVRMLS